MLQYLDPRTKLIISFCISLLAIIYNQPVQLFFLLIFTYLFTGLFGVNFLKTINRFRIFIPLLLVLLIVQSIFAPSGQIILQVGNIPFLTMGGINLGLSVLLRMLILLCSALFIMTGTPQDLVLGLVQWRIPYEIAFMAVLGLGFIPLFKDEVKDAFIAVQLRGREVKKGSIREGLTLLSAIFFPLVYGVLVKAHKMTIAMEARGFRAYKTRTYLRRLTLQRTDYLLMFFFLFSTCALIIAELV